MQIICTSLQTDNHASTLPLNFFQAGCSSWRLTNCQRSVNSQHWHQPWKIISWLHHFLIYHLTPKKLHSIYTGGASSLEKVSYFLWLCYWLTRIFLNKGSKSRSYVGVRPSTLVLILIPMFSRMYGYVVWPVPSVPVGFVNVSRTASSLSFVWNSPVDANGILRDYKVTRCCSLYNSHCPAY